MNFAAAAATQNRQRKLQYSYAATAGLLWPMQHTIANLQSLFASRSRRREANL
jgi:hypothetical protein